MPLYMVRNDITTMQVDFIEDERPDPVKDGHLGIRPPNAHFSSFYAHIKISLHFTAGIFL